MKIKKQRSKPVVETQMVSLADIAFLIIFFFMLSSQFMKDRAALNLPKMPKTDETKSQITVTTDTNGDLLLNGDSLGKVRVKEDGGKYHMDSLPVANLETELKKLLAGRPLKDCEVKFKCDQTVTFEQYTPVIEAISNAGGTVMIMQDVR
jgi:biopolymer transport protein ExbD